MKKIRVFEFVAIFLFVWDSGIAQGQQNYWENHGPKSSEWVSGLSFSDNLKQLNIPPQQIQLISTDQLIGICLDYPGFGLVFAFNTFQEGYEFIRKNFNGFEELEKRAELKALMKKYQSLNPEDVMLKSTSLQKGKFMARFNYIELLIGQDSILAKFDLDTKRQLLEVALKNYKLKAKINTYGILGISTTAFIISKLIIYFDNTDHFISSDERRNFNSFNKSCFVEDSSILQSLINIAESYIDNQLLK
jgi:hypothetical protein